MKKSTKNPENILFHPTGISKYDLIIADFVRQYPIIELEAEILCLLADYDRKRLDIAGQLLLHGINFTTIRRKLYENTI